MFCEMTPGSDLSLPITRGGIRRNCCIKKRKSEWVCSFSGSTMELEQTECPFFRTCKDCVRMEQRQAAMSLDGTEGRFRDLTSKWFIDTQIPLIVQNGFFPSWFLGFITRQDAEEILRGKELGCFLVRLSDKTIGYILSYKGGDRCRHFVINQSETGQFVIYGDTKEHETVSDLIQHYKIYPVQPFGEYLTSSCSEAQNVDLYDMIQVCHRGRSATVFREDENVQNHWIGTGEPPVRPPKSFRTPEEVPPLPLRSRNLNAVPLMDQNKVSYAQLRKQPRKERPRSQFMNQDDDSVDMDMSGSSPQSVYPQLSLLESKSRSLPLLDNRSDGDQSYRLSPPPHIAPRLSPKPIRQVASCSPQLERADVCSRLSSSHSMELMGDGAVYHLAGNPESLHTTAHERRQMASEQLDDSVYAEVHTDVFVCRTPCCNTYEQIPLSEDSAQPEPNSNTYEPLEDMRPNHPTRGLKNDKWKWLFPELRRKW